MPNWMNDDEILAWEESVREAIAREDANSSGSSTAAAHDCFAATPRYKGFAVQTLGEHDWWEVSLHRCVACGRTYLHVFLEDDGMPRSGRWYMARVPCDVGSADIPARQARRLLAGRDRVFFGGSYWAHAGEWSDRPEAFRDLATSG